MNFPLKTVVPIISYSPSFDDSNAKHNVHIFIILL